MDHKAFMCACFGFPHCIWMDRVLVKLITLLAWLFLVFNCVCVCLWWISKGFFILAQRRRQLVSSQGCRPSAGPDSTQLDYRVDRIVHEPRQPRLQHNSPAVGLKLHRRTSDHLHVRPSYAQRPRLNVFSIWEENLSTHQQSLNPFT